MSPGRAPSSASPRATLLADARRGHLAERIEHEDEMEVAAMLTARGSTLQEDGTYGDELARRLGLDVTVFVCHSVGSRRRGRWYRYAIQPSHGSIPDVIARSHAAAAAVLLVELLARRGLEAPADLVALASRVLAEGGAGWVGP